MNRTIAGGLALSALTLTTACAPQKTAQQYYQDPRATQLRTEMCERFGIAGQAQDCINASTAALRQALHGNSAGDPSRS